MLSVHKYLVAGQGIQQYYAPLAMVDHLMVDWCAYRGCESISVGVWLYILSLIVDFLHNSLLFYRNGGK